MAVSEDDDLAERWYALDLADVASRLGVEPGRGLTAEQVRLRTDDYGPNALAETPRRRGSSCSSTSSGHSWRTC